MFTKRRQETGSEFLSHEQHRVVAISVVMRSRDSLKVWSLGDEASSEKDLIERFFDGLDKFTPDLVSWNGAGFDLPVLHYRSLLHSVTAARYWETGDSDQSFRYSNYLSRFHWRHMDLMDILSGFQGRGRASLAGHRDAARLSRASSACTAREVWDAYLRGRPGAHPRLLRDRCAEHLSDLSALPAVARASERRRARARGRAGAHAAGRVARGPSPRIRGSVAREPEARPRSRRPTSSIWRTTAAASRAIDGKAVFIDGALPGERVRFRVHQAPPAIGRGGSGRCARRHRPTASRRAARTSEFAAAARCSTCRRRRSWRRSSGSCSRICERIGRVRPERVLRAAARTGVGLSAPRAAWRQVRAQEGPGAGGLSRARKTLHRRHPALRGAARAAGESAAGAWRRWSRHSTHPREHAAGRSGGGRRARTALVFRVLEPPGAEDLDKLAAFGAAAWRADLPADRRPRHRAAAARWTIRRSTYAVDAGRVVIEFGPVDFIQVNRAHQCVAWWMPAMELLQPQAGTIGARPVLRPGQFHPAVGAPRAAGRGRGGRCGAGGEGARQRARATASAMPNSSVDNLFEPAAFGAWAQRALRSGAARPAARRRSRAAGAHAALASAPSRVYFLPSGEFGAGCGDPGRTSSGIQADRSRGDGHVSAYDARRIDRGVRG